MLNTLQFSYIIVWSGRIILYNLYNATLTACGVDVVHCIEISRGTATMADDRVVPRLRMWAYYACNEVKRPTRVDMQSCCESLFKIVQLNSVDGVFDSLGDRQSIFNKVQDRNYYLIGNVCNDAASHGHIDTV